MDNNVLNRNTVAVNSSLSVSGELVNSTFINDTTKRFHFNTSELISIQDGNFTLGSSLTFNDGSCFENVPYVFPGMYPSLLCYVYSMC